MKSLRDYITETETWVDNPAQGDDFDIELAPDELLESYVVEVMEDGIVISGDDRVVSLLESFGHTTETIRRYGPVGSNRGVGFTLEEDEEEEEIEEGAMSDLDIERQDYERMTPQQFYAAYKITKADWAAKNRDVAESQDDFGRIMELAGVADHRFDREDDVYREDQAADIVAKKELDADITDPMPGVHEDGVDPVNQFGQDAEELEGNMTAEAEYQGRNVPLGKPMRGDVKKFKVYVKDPATGNIKKVNFGHGGTSAKKAGQKTMKIKKSNPARRKSFRARHNCDNPGPRTKARYWSCRAW